jgi:hypothetical protein
VRKARHQGILDLLAVPTTNPDEGVVVEIGAVAYRADDILS